MEPAQLSNKLKNSMFSRKKPLNYSISHKQKQTYNNRVSLSKSSQIHEESTNPSP